MKLGARFAGVALLLAAASGALGACQSLAGIHDRTFVDGGLDTPSAACVQYCDLAETVCTDSGHPIYKDPTYCLALCKDIPEDVGGEITPNSVSCRIKELNLAKQTAGDNDVAQSCSNAGPGGNGVCGSNCANYCALYAAACKAELPELGDTQYDQATCEAKCKGLAQTPNFDAQGNYDGDTLQCRLVHVSAAAVDPKTHCSHATLQARPPSPCVDEDTDTPDCDKYCTLELVACPKGPQQVYEDKPQCLAVCKALPRGDVTDTTQNTVGCRKYHSYNALLAPEQHCAHTGPGGDGHCASPIDPQNPVTGNCESYCILLQQACQASIPGLAAEDSFEQNFGDLATCGKICSDLDGAAFEAPYTLSPKLPTGNNLQCRLLHVSRALTVPLDECGAALGLRGTPCH